MSGERSFILIRIGQMRIFCQALGKELWVESVLGPAFKELILQLFLQAVGLVLWRSTLSPDRAVLSLMVNMCSMAGQPYKYSLCP